jgi:nucleoside-triphosphatase THEP1
VSGILSPAVFEAGQKTGIEAIDLRTGQRRLLAVRRQAGQTRTEFHTDRWHFDAEVMAWGDTVLQSAAPCDLLVVDELGPLEFERGAGWQAGLAALDSGQYRGAVVIIRPELLQTACQRWPAAHVIRITSATDVEANAKQLAQQLGAANHESSPGF